MFFHSTSRGIKANVFLLLVFSFMAISQSSFAQQDKKIDSLLNVLKTAKEDTGKVNTLNALSAQFEKLKNFIATKNYADTAMALAERLHFKKGIADSYFNYGRMYYHQDNFKESLKKFQAGLKICEGTALKKEIARFHQHIGQDYYYTGNYTEALKNHLAALKIFEDIGDKRGLATSYTNVGLIYYEQQNYNEVLKYYLASLKIFQEIGDKQLIGIAYFNIGLFYETTGNKAEALKNYLASLKVREEMGDKGNSAYSHLAIGDIYSGQANYPEALRNYKIALQISDNKWLISATYISLGVLSFKTNKLSEAKKYLNDGLKLSKETSSFHDMKNAYQQLAIVDSAMGDYRRALINYKLYTYFKDSVLNEENSKLITEMKEKYESEKKDEEIALLNKEKVIQTLELKKQSQTKSYLIAGLCLFAILSFFVYRNYRTRQKLKLQTLRNKIASDLHDDVGSTLSSISIFSEMAKQQSKEVIPMLDTIGESSRKMLDAMADIVWTIKPENDQFEKIIMRMRSFAYELLGAKKIDFEFQADEDVSNMKLSMDVRKNLYLIFKEATNNLVKYSGADRAFFAVKKDANNLTMLIRDNGKGFDTVNAKHGNGLVNMKKRADEIGAKFILDSLPGNGTTIQLKVAV